MASARTRCESALAREPLPLYSERLELALLWNAKAACTFAIKWLYFQEGVLEEAEAYSRWPHQYRQHVYCRRPGYTDQLRHIPALGPRAIKVVRNPYDRAVGAYLSYSHLATMPLLPTRGRIVRAVRRRLGRPAPPSRAQHTPMLRAIGSHLGRPVGDGQLFTFREFVGFLASLDLDGADIHVRRQVHPCERDGALPQLRLMRVEESATAFPQLEDELGLRRSDLDALQASRHHTQRVAGMGFAADTHFGRTTGVPVPLSADFYDAALLATVRRLYAEDCARYGYEGPT